MTTILKEAYIEVNQVLEILGDNYTKKIPPKVLKLFREHKNEHYKNKIEKNFTVQNIEISRTALIIISILNLKYWAKDEEKEKLKKQYEQNEMQLICQN